MPDEIARMLGQTASSIPVRSIDSNVFVEAALVRQQRRTTAARATAVGVVGALASAIVLVSPAGTPAALAGWTNEPQPVSDEVRTQLQQDCAQDDEPEDAGVPQWVADLTAHPGPPDLVDRRGGAAVALWRWTEGDRQLVLTCTRVDTDGDGRPDLGGSATASGAVEVGPPSYRGGTTTSGDYRIEEWYGIAPSGTGQVVAVRSDGTRVTASMGQDDLFLVWWPDLGEHAELDRLEMFDSTGEPTAAWDPKDTRSA